MGNRIHRYEQCLDHERYDKLVADEKAAREKAGGGGAGGSVADNRYGAVCVTKQANPRR